MKNNLSKKIIIFLLITISIIIASAISCGSTNSSEKVNAKTNMSNRFKALDSYVLKDGNTLMIYYDTETKIMYQFIDGFESLSSISLIYEEDGITPAKYKEVD